MTPKRGEVAMILSREDAGRVVVHIESLSRTVDPIARAASRATRAVQKRVTAR